MASTHDFFKKYKIASEDDAAHYMKDHSLVNADNWFNRHRYALVTNFIPNPITDKQKLLDFGCGSGHFLRYLRDNNFSLSLTGFEPYWTLDDTKDLKILQDKRINFLKTFKDVTGTTYDIITALDVLEHIKNDEKALRDIHTVLQPNGKLLLTVPAYPWLYSWHDAILGHRRRYTHTSIQTVLTKAGFTLVEYKYFFSFLIPAALLIKYYLALKKIMKKELHLDGLLHDPLGIFHRMTVIEKFLIQRGVKLPCGCFLFVYASKYPERHRPRSRQRPRLTCSEQTGCVSHKRDRSIKHMLAPQHSFCWITSCS